VDLLLPVALTVAVLFVLGSDLDKNQKLWFNGLEIHLALALMFLALLTQKQGHMRARCVIKMTLLLKCCDSLPFLSFTYSMQWSHSASVEWRKLIAVYFIHFYISPLNNLFYSRSFWHSFSLSLRF
jgi:hypothetical protein